MIGTISQTLIFLLVAAANYGIILLPTWVIFFFFRSDIPAEFYGIPINAYTATGALLLCCIALSVTSISEWVCSIAQGSRRLSQRETETIIPALDDVVGALQLPKRNFKVRIIDTPLPNAYSIGNRTIVVTSGLLDSVNAQQLRAVLAHEIGHLYRGDASTLATVFTMNIFGSSVAYLLVALATLFGMYGQQRTGTSFGQRLTFQSKKGFAESAIGKIFGLFWGLFVLIFALFLRFTILILKQITDLAAKILSRHSEYEADGFALLAGYGQGMITYLEFIKPINYGNEKPTFFTSLAAGHPAAELRIDKIFQRTREA